MKFIMRTPWAKMADFAAQKADFATQKADFANKNEKMRNFAFLVFRSWAASFLRGWCGKCEA